MKFLKYGAIQDKYLFKIAKHQNGVLVSGISKNKFEDEVLFAPRTMFRVVSVDRKPYQSGTSLFLVELHEMV